MKLNLEWLWIAWKQVNTGEDFATWVIQNHRVNEQVFLKSKKPEATEYSLPKDIKAKVEVDNYRYDNTEEYLGGD